MQKRIIVVSKIGESLARGGPEIQSSCRPLGPPPSQLAVHCSCCQAASQPQGTGDWRAPCQTGLGGAPPWSSVGGRRATSRWGQGGQVPLPAGWTGASPRGDRLGDSCEGRTPQRPSVAGVPLAPAGWTQDSKRRRQSGRAGDTQEGGALYPTEPPTFRDPHGSPPLQESPRGRLHCPGQARLPVTPPRIHTPPSAGQGQTPAGLRVQTGTAGGARSQENCRDAELQGGQRGCLKTHRSPGPRGSARRKLAAPGQRLSQHPPTSTQDGSGHSADRCSQGRRTAPGSDPRWAGREAKHTGPALGSLRLVNKPASHWKH